MMRLGTDTGSLVNHMMSGGSGVKPEVGMGATVLAWTDRYAGTITEVQEDGTVIVQEDRAIRTDNNGMSDDQSYRYERNPEGRIFVFKPVKRGRMAGHLRLNGKASDYGVLIGERRAYHDFSF